MTRQRILMLTVSAAAAVLLATGMVTAQTSPQPTPEPTADHPPAQVAPPPLNAAPPDETVPAILPPVAPTPAVKAPGTDKKDDKPKVAKVSAPVEPVAPEKRLRHGSAIIQALDKITTESMRFEVPVGKSIRYKGLVFTVRACETSAPDEVAPDAVAYVEVHASPKAQAEDQVARPVFHGWMFASSPGLDAFQHPVYDAWLIGCKA